MRILISGSLAYDRIMDFDGFFKDHILPDKIHILNVSFFVKKFSQSFGGTAGNIAYTLSLLNEEAVILATYGHDFAEYARWCRKNGMIIAYGKKINDLPTASVYIITDKNDNQIAGFFAGAMKHSNGLPPKKLLNKESLAIISPGNPDDMKKYPKVFRRTGTRYIYDPGQQIPVLSKGNLINGLRGAMALISNDYELSLILKKIGLTIKKLLAFNKFVVTTKGKKGSIITTSSQKYIIPSAKPKNESDPTGAGDAYRAGFIKGLAMGYPLPKAGRLAALVSVYTVEKYGTQTHYFTWKDLKQRYYQNFKEPL